MTVVSSVPSDIVSLRMTHCRAEHAAKEAQYHLAVLHYRACFEAAEYRQDIRAMQFFALRLADCYDLMHFAAKAAGFRALAEAAEQPAFFE